MTKAKGSRASGTTAMSEVRTSTGSEDVGGAAPQELTTPSADALLAAVLELGREIHLEMDEPSLVDLFCRTMKRLFPCRFVAVRVVDILADDSARVYCATGGLRRGVDKERLTLKPSSVTKTRLKTALAESARLRISNRWDSPFEGTAAGFAVPLVAAGELYGVLDVGYPLGVDGSATDEPLMLPMANHLSVALRNQRLHLETTNLRDYQARLIEEANALILGIGPDWRINVCNRAICRLTAFERQELLGRDLRDWVPADDHARLTRLFNQAMAGRRIESVDVVLPTKDGVAIRTVWSVAAITRKGKIQALVGVGQDQTRIRQLQEQIIHAEKLATLGQLAAGVVHELNNPLTSISIYAEYLQKKLCDRLEDGDMAKLRQIGASAGRIMAFAKDLVQYAKPSSEVAEPIYLNFAVKQALSFCEHLFDRADVTLVEELSDDIPQLLAVPGQLEQIVINLVTNAVHALGGASGRVVVKTTRCADGLALEVGDSGPGIPVSEREHVFEPFFTTKTDGEGTGLGLSIVKNIVEEHEGRIEVGQSSYGGALFTVWLPIADRAG